MNNVVLLIGGALAIRALTKYNTTSNLQFLPLGAAWNGGQLAITIGVQNPTSTSLVINSFAGQVYVNGTASGNLSDFTTRTIAANQQTPVQLNFTPSVLGILSDISSAITQSNGLQIELKGTANVNNVPVPLDLTFQAIGSS